ncbi:MAG: FkbM family methyltransferase [Planctomycetota bacterium]|nr:FkbM family methyltransferase [Planctomycetota bacterium]
MNSIEAILFVNIYYVLSRLPNYVKRIGLFRGLCIWWQIELSLTNDPTRLLRIVLPGQPNPMYIRQCRSDRATFWQCIIKQQYSISHLPQHVRLDQKYLDALNRKVTPFIIDGGANIGLATLFFLSKFPEAFIIAVEPDKANMEILKKNTEPFADRVRLVHGALWNESQELQIQNMDVGAASFRMQHSTPADSGGDAQNSIPAVCVNSLIKELSIGLLLIVKLDIEGSQDMLFSSNTEWVGTALMISLELDDWQYPWEGTSRSFFACLSKYPIDYLISEESIFCFLDIEQSL